MKPVFAARTGYTGEDGVELFFPAEIAEAFFDALLEAGKPLGLKPTPPACSTKLNT